MALFKPNLNCTIRTVTGLNVYGEEALTVGTAARCAIVKLVIMEEKSTVRADSSASRGASREYVSQGVLLFPASAGISMGCQVEVAGRKLRVVGIQPRHNLQGVYDHDEAIVAIWGKQ